MVELVDRVAAMEARARSRSAERRAAVVAEDAARAAKSVELKAGLRETMPAVAAAVDAFRAVFGEGVRVLAAAENGRCVVNRKACERFGVDVRAYEAFAKR